MADNLETVINKYLEFKSQFWAASTVKSERARLNTLKAEIFKVKGFHPAEIFRALKDAGLKDYTITTMMIRLADLEEFAHEHDLMPEGETRQCRDFCRRYLRSHNKRAYQRTAPKVSFEEAQKRIAQISCKKTRELALALLETGLRFTESTKVKRDETAHAVVEGKGGYIRPVFNLNRELPQGVKHWQFWRDLKKSTGLKPHDLRKIAANRLATKLAVHELQQAMGWRRLETAQSYLKVTDMAALDQKIRAI